MKEDLEEYIYSFIFTFFLQLNESTDISDTSQLIVKTIIIVFDNFTTKEEFLKILLLVRPTRGDDILAVFKKYAEENNLSL